MGGAPAGAPAAMGVTATAPTSPTAPTVGAPTPQAPGGRPSVQTHDPDAIASTQFFAPDGSKLDEKPGIGKKPVDQQKSGGLLGFGQSTGVADGTVKEIIYADGRKTREVYKGGAWGPPQAMPKVREVADEFVKKTNDAARTSAQNDASYSAVDKANAALADLYPAQARQSNALAAGHEQENAFRAAHGGHNPAELTQQWNAVQQFARDQVGKDANQLEWAKAYLAQEHQNFVNGMQTAQLNLDKAKVGSSERATDMSMATDIARQTGENARAMLPYMQTPEQGKYRASLIDHMMHSGEPNQPPMPNAPANQGAPLFDPRTLAHQAAMQVLGPKYGQGGAPGTAFTLPPSTDLSGIKAPAMPFPQGGPIANPGQVSSAFATPPAGGTPGAPPPNPMLNPQGGASGNAFAAAGMQPQMMTPQGPRPTIGGPSPWVLGPGGQLVPAT